MKVATYKPEQIAAFIAKVKFNQEGLIPAIAQQNGSGKILMLAWMNAESLRQTLVTGQVTYWSRSRNELWTKGKTSGHTQQLHAIALDCDNDALLLQVEQKGPACHTGQASCFFNHLTSL